MSTPDTGPRTPDTSRSPDTGPSTPDTRTGDTSDDPVVDSLEAINRGRAAEVEAEERGQREAAEQRAREIANQHWEAKKKRSLLADDAKTIAVVGSGGMMKAAWWGTKRTMGGLKNGAVGILEWVGGLIDNLAMRFVKGSDTTFITDFVDKRPWLSGEESEAAKKAREKKQKERDKKWKEKWTGKKDKKKDKKKERKKDD